MGLKKILIKKVKMSNKGPTIRFIGYSGKAVDLSDHGFDAPVFYDIPTMKLKNGMAVKFDHARDIGKTSKFHKSTKHKDVRGEGRLTVKNKTTTRIVKNPDDYEMSFGLDVSSAEIVYFENGTVVNGRKYNKPCYVMFNTVGEEITICNEGRDRSTGMRVYNSKLSSSELEAIKNEGEQDWDVTVPDKFDEEFDEFLNNSAAFNNPSDDDDWDNDDDDFVENSDDDSWDTDFVFDDQVENRQRRRSKPRRSHTCANLSAQQMRQLTKRIPNSTDIIETAIDEGWSLNRLENQLQVRRLENTLGTNNRIPRSKSDDNEDRLLEARLTRAIANRAWKEGSSVEEYAHSVLKNSYGDKLAERAMKQNIMGMTEILVNCARRLGDTSASGFANPMHLANFVQRHNIARLPSIGSNGEVIRNSAGLSSFDMPNLFERATTFVVDEAWKVRDTDLASRICYPTSHKDFRTVQRIRPAGGQMWKGLLPDGRIQSGSFGDEIEYTEKLDTTAQYVMFARKWIMNDDFDIIAELINLMIEGAMIVPNVKLADKMLGATGSAGSGDFWESNYNDFAGASNALAIANLGTIWDRISTRTIDKGEVDWQQDLDDEWNIIVGSNQLERAAFEIFDQPILLSNAAGAGERNFWHNKFKTVKFKQLLSNGISGGQADMWWMWPKSVQNAPFSISSLRGQTKPVVYMIDAPGDMLGFGIAGYYDIEINERERSAIHRLRPTGSL